MQTNKKVKALGEVKELLWSYRRLLIEEDGDGALAVGFDR
jgi:hypothetical protein